MNGDKAPAKAWGYILYRVLAVATLLGVILFVSISASADSLAQRVWKRYGNAPSLQIRAVSRFEDLSLEAKPSAYANVDLARWKQMEQEVKRLVGQEIRTELAVLRPNRLYIEERSAFGWFHSICDGRVWRAQRQGNTATQMTAPRTLAQMAETRYHRFLGLEEQDDTDVLRLLAIGSPRLRQRLLGAKEQPADKPNLKLLVWSERVTYEGMKGQGTITCVVDARSAFIQRVEYRYRIGYGTEAWLNIVIGQRWDNSQISKPPPPSRFRVEQGREASTR
ncbi:MAG: hypothetical protein KatS3mg022_2129 [Armatimonadota bacterium]|nr:MAG: hypothetical protein KatS3mg022_2129 [Armatimonadota bacterium]